MHPPALIYGLDIETDTSVDGLDPAESPVVTVALSTPAGDEVFAGPEADMLAALDARIRRLEPGVLATWNGAAFDGTARPMAPRGRVIVIVSYERDRLPHDQTRDRSPAARHCPARAGVGRRRAAASEVP